MQNIVFNWVELHYFLIMHELDRLTHLYGVPKRELVLELDFYAKHGTVPALCTPDPFFKVGVSKDYFEGDRPEEPDWFFKGTSEYQSHIRIFVTGMLDQYERTTPNQILVILRDPMGNAGIYRVQDGVHGTNTSLFSDAALEAFSQLMRHDNDDGSLDQAYTPAFARVIRKYRDKYRSTGENPSLQADIALAFRISDLYQAGFDGSSNNDDDDP